MPSVVSSPLTLSLVVGRGCSHGRRLWSEILHSRLDIDQRVRLEHCRKHLQWAGELTTVWNFALSDPQEKAEQELKNLKELKRLSWLLAFPRADGVDNAVQLLRLPEACWPGGAEGRCCHGLSDARRVRIYTVFRHTMPY